MGLGSSPAGTTQAGFDAQVFGARVETMQVAALKVDGATRDYVRDSAGRLVGEHPVDATVFHRLRILAGTVRSAPGTGHTIGGAWVDTRTIDALVRDRVNLTLADMIAAGDITLRLITVDTAVRGRVLFQVDYVNNRTGRPGSFRSPQ